MTQSDKGKSKSIQNQVESNLVDHNSETTIYKDALEHIEQTVDNSDAEITFNMNKTKQKSDESDDPTQIDTSDEMLEMDDADKFIAECAQEARRQITPPRSSANQKTNIDRGEQVIREAEAERA